MSNKRRVKKDLTSGKRITQSSLNSCQTIDGSEGSHGGQLNCFQK
jgi:hypothetical protein